MAKRKKKSTNKSKNMRQAAAKQTAETVVRDDSSTQEVETSDIVLSEVKNKPTKAERKQAKEAQKLALSKKKDKAAKNAAPKRHRIREVFSELKKVSWPTFKKTCKQTGAVLVVVVVFMLVVLGIDSLLGWLISLIGKI